jgi:hypothetical protein
MKAKSINIIYQLLWFSIFSIFNPSPKKTLSLDDFLVRSIERFVFQIKLARFLSNAFKVKILLLIGDSNSGVFNSYSSAIRFNAITITLGVPGTQSLQWNKLLELDEARELKSLLDWIDKEHIFCWNIGGNFVLQGLMSEAEESLLKLWKLFPHSFNILIPPIHTSLLESVPNDIDYEYDVEIINSYITRFWGIRAINLRLLFLNPWTNDSWYGYLSDPVHYSFKGKKIIARALNMVLGFA